MNGEIVDLMPPTPSPVKTIETANPGIPAPLSRATGREVINMTEEPHIRRLGIVRTIRCLVKLIGSWIKRHSFCHRRLT
jgi:hypothetical protein